MNELFYYLSDMDSVGGVLSALFAAAMFAFSAWMIIDCLRNQREFWWLWVIFMTGGFGAFIYFYMHHWDGSLMDGFLGGNAATRRQLKEVQGQVHFCPNAANYEALGDVYRNMGKLREAEGAYRTALAQAPDAFDIKAHLGYVILGLKRPEEAWALLEPAFKLQPGFDRDELLWQCARCQVARGQLEEARALYERFLDRHSFYEAQVEYGALLLKIGDRMEAAKVAREIIDDLRNSPAYIVRQNKQWSGRAKKLLSACNV
ncbi:MAG: tetratricopeptide repeat protein [Chthoniobacteraceae bacterium]|nr:tetratricopeptide repeat protein [Chthoniobacteraceae bacterium]MDB6173237.1 tetratricopeptide repeat protein [Chthoniobacteraceae bacterium]